MDKIAFVIRLFLFFLSCYGYIQYLRRFVPIEFCIGLLFSGISSILFFAGILNLLPAAALALFVCGLILTGYSVKQQMRIADILCPGTAFFLILSVFFLFLLPGSKFVHYDNFSHWATVARVLIEYHRFPNFQDPYIVFTSYPLGSASFIFYVTGIAGVSSEWMQMYAQAILMAGMAVSLFAFVKGRIPSLIAAFCCICLLCSNNSFFDILVDNLLSVTALSAAAFCIYYGRELKTRIWFFLPYVVFLLSVKNSGLFFVILLYGYIWFTLRREAVPSKTWLVLFAVPVMTLVLWQAHVNLVFPNGMSGKHSMSLSYFSSIIQEKQLSDILAIVKAMAFRVFSVSNHGLLALLSGLLIWLVWRKFSSQPCQEMKTTLLLAAAAYVLYQIGNLGMYIFSMPIWEAMILSEYDRYHQTIITFVAGLFFLEAIQASHLPLVSGRRNALSLCTVLAALIVSFFVLSPDFTCFQRQQLDNTMRGRLEQLIQDYDIPCGSEYLVFVRNQDVSFLNFMCQYVLRPQGLFIQSENEMSLSGLSYIDYIIAFDETEKTEAFISQLSPGYTDPVYRLF